MRWQNVGHGDELSRVALRARRVGGKCCRCRACGFRYSKRWLWGPGGDTHTRSPGTDVETELIEPCCWPPAVQRSRGSSSIICSLHKRQSHRFGRSFKAGKGKDSLDRIWFAPCVSHLIVSAEPPTPSLTPSREDQCDISAGKIHY